MVDRERRLLAVESRSPEKRLIQETALRERGRKITLSSAERHLKRRVERGLGNNSGNRKMANDDGERHLRRKEVWKEVCDTITAVEKWRMTTAGDGREGKNSFTTSLSNVHRLNAEKRSVADEQSREKVRVEEFHKKDHPNVNSNTT